MLLDSGPQAKKRQGHCPGRGGLRAFLCAHGPGPFRRNATVRHVRGVGRVVGVEEDEDEDEEVRPCIENVHL